MPKFNIYQTPHVHSQVVCSALAKGTGLPLVDPAPLRDGGVVMYGFLRGLLPTLTAARLAGRPWVYADRGYLRATYGNDHTGFFRVTRCAFQHDGRGQADPARFKALNIKMASWHRNGKHVLVCPPGDVFTRAIGNFAAAEWLQNTLATLAAHTQRPIRVRHKPAMDKPHAPLSDDLRDCWALVTYMSNTAVEAVLEGIPVFVTGRCAAASMGKSDLREIEAPAYPDRDAWAAALAANQWTLDELARGAANHLFQ